VVYCDSDDDLPGHQFQHQKNDLVCLFPLSLLVAEQSLWPLCLVTSAVELWLPGSLLTPWHVAGSLAA